MISAHVFDVCHSSTTSQSRCREDVRLTDLGNDGCIQIAEGLKSNQAGRGRTWKCFRFTAGDNSHRHHTSYSSHLMPFSTWGVLTLAARCFMLSTKFARCVCTGILSVGCLVSFWKFRARPSSIWTYATTKSTTKAEHGGAPDVEAKLPGSPMVTDGDRWCTFACRRKCGELYRYGCGHILTLLSAA